MITVMTTRQAPATIMRLIELQRIALGDPLTPLPGAGQYKELALEDGHGEQITRDFGGGMGGKGDVFGTVLDALGRPKPGGRIPGRDRVRGRHGDAGRAGGGAEVGCGDRESVCRASCACASPPAPPI